MLLFNNLRPSGEEVKAKNEKHLTRVYAPARWASVVNARQTNHTPLRCCRPRLHASVQDRRTRPPHKRKLPAFAIWRHERKEAREEKTISRDQNQRSTKDIVILHSPWAPQRNTSFAPSAIRHVFRLASDAPLSRPFFPSLSRAKCNLNSSSPPFPVSCSSFFSQQSPRL